MPVGVLVTVPEPLPDGKTVRRKVLRVKLAVTVVAAVTLTSQVPVPEQPPPDQPVKFELTAGVAVNVTVVL